MPELQPGDPRRLGSYELLERLGEGGQGVVYLGRDASGNNFAIKLLRADLTEDESARHRFVREAQAAKQVARFCTAQMIEADMVGDQPYIVSEYVPGPSLYKQVKEQGPIAGAALERLAIGTATALVAIHQAGIVHRDFKPHNVLMAPDGPRVIDFGIARALDAGQTAATKAIGTPSYMAPEQVAGATLTEAVDVFAWASTMVYAASGTPPFGDDTVMAVINRVLHEAPSVESVPADLRGLISACLVKEPERRPTAQQIMMTLIGTGPQETRMDDAAQATRMMAAGAAGAAGGAAGMSAADQTVAYDRTQRMGAASGATLPGAAPPARPGHYEPERKRNAWPIVAGVAAILLVAVIVGVVMAATGDKKPDSPVTPGTSESETASPTEDETTEVPPTRDTPTREPTTEPTTERPPTSEAPTTPPTSEEPTTPPPSTPSSPPATGGGGGGDGDGGGDGGDGGGGGDPGGGTGTGTGAGTGTGNNAGGGSG